MPSRPIHLMVVGAHPADTFDQAGGTLAHHVALGDAVTVVIATTGVRSHHWELADKKQKLGADFDMENAVSQAKHDKLEEVRKACRIMGFDDVRDLGFEDDEILVTQDKIEAIADMIRDVKPDVVITHHPYEGGGFKLHATIGQATIYAWQLASGAGRGRQERHLVPVIYFMNPLAYTGNIGLGYAGTARADLYVDITDVIERKVAALDCIGTQFYGGAYARKRAETEDGALGQKVNVAYAEQFQRFRPEVRYTLSVSDFELNAIDESPEASMIRRGEMVGGLMPLPPNIGFSPEHRVPRERYEG